MQSEIKYFPVNWVDGMKISKSHLLSLQQAVDDQIRDSIATAHLHSDFGLLPFIRNPNDLSVQTDQAGNIKLNARTCLAITPDGSRIQITENQPVTLDISSSELLHIHNIAPSDEALFYIVISVNPYKRVPFGNPVENELPPRNPFTSASYKLDIIPASTLNLAQFETSSLIIGKLIYKRGEFRHALEFVPACTCIRAHPGLIDFYNNTGKALAMIGQSSFLILQKIRSKDQKTPLGSSIYLLAERLGFDTSASLLQYKNTLPDQSPLHLFTLLLRVPNTINDVLSILTAKEREELLSYLGEWSNLAPGELETRTHGFFADFSYVHHDPMLSLSGIHDYVKIISELLSVLSQLEFIGKRKGQSVFIVEHEVARENPDKARSRWSPLS